MKEPNNAKCPHCGSETIDGNSFDVQGHRVYQEMCCLKCGDYWDDVYQLIAQLNGDGKRLTEVKS